MIDRATAGLTDPAERLAGGTRISGRLGWTHPEIAAFLTGAGLDALDIQYLGGDDHWFRDLRPRLETYTDAILRTGERTGHLNDAFDTAAIIQLADYPAPGARIRTAR